VADIADLSSRRVFTHLAEIAGAEARADRYLRQARRFAADGAAAVLGRFRPTITVLADLRAGILDAMDRARYDEGDIALLAGVELERARTFLRGSDVVDPFDALRLAMIAGVGVPLSGRR